MDLNLEKGRMGSNQEEVATKLLKRKMFEEITEAHKKLKTSEESTAYSHLNNERVEATGKLEKTKVTGTTGNTLTATKVSSSPKKRLELSIPTSRLKVNKEKFIYGNYSQYYGYRNKNNNYDIRLNIFAEYRNIFKNKRILDIGCNNGFITMEITKQFEVESSVGLDIDKSLINQAIKNLTEIKKTLPMDNEMKRLHKFPFNIKFVHGNYVLKDDVLLEIESAQFDVILCLSITKWIHLNFGDKGLKQSFKRMFLQLKPQGKLILEAQPFDNYARRKKMTDTIYKNFKEIKFLPNDFTEYLLSSEVGFTKVELMGVPEHCAKGFKRPIQIFFKS